MKLFREASGHVQVLQTPFNWLFQRSNGNRVAWLSPTLQELQTSVPRPLHVRQVVGPRSSREDACMNATIEALSYALNSGQCKQAGKNIVLPYTHPS